MHFFTLTLIQISVAASLCNVETKRGAKHTAVFCCYYYGCSCYYYGCSCYYYYYGCSCCYYYYYGCSCYYYGCYYYGCSC